MRIVLFMEKEKKIPQFIAFFFWDYAQKRFW